MIASVIARWTTRPLENTTPVKLNMPILVPSFLAIQAGLLAYSATTHSPTELEPAFLASGVYHWKTGRFEPYRVNPPLARMVAALPVIAGGCRSDWRRFTPSAAVRTEFGIGSDFIASNGPDSTRLLVYARWVCIPFSLLGAWVACRWASELYGPSAGLITLILYVFEPSLLAHGELVTPDAACVSLGLASSYAFWRWLKRPSWRHALIAGICLGLVELTKLSWLILFPLWPFMWFVWPYFSSLATKFRAAKLGPAPPRPPTFNEVQVFPPTRAIQFTQLAVIMFLGGYIINLGYCFDGTMTMLKKYEFSSSTLSGQAAGELGNRFADSIMGVLPVPFPRPYVEGIDLQKKDFEDYPKPSYLNGEWRRGGWWYYYCYGFLIKTPCGTLGLLALVIACRTILRSGGVSARDEFALFCPAVSILVLVSSQTEFNIHLRYAAPVVGFLLIFAGQSKDVLNACLHLGKRYFDRIASDPDNSSVTALSSLSSMTSGLVVGCLVISSVVSLLRVFPYHLAYFNETSGGPDRGYYHLLGSNFDWGQGLLSAERVMRKHPGFTEYLPAEQCALAISLGISLHLPSYDDLGGADELPIKLPALISPNVLIEVMPIVGFAGHRTRAVQFTIPSGCSVRVYDGLLMVTRGPR